MAVYAGQLSRAWSAIAFASFGGAGGAVVQFSPAGVERVGRILQRRKRFVSDHANLAIKVDSAEDAGNLQRDAADANGVALAHLKVTRGRVTQEDDLGFAVFQPRELRWPDYIRDAREL